MLPEEQVTSPGLVETPPGKTRNPFWTYMDLLLVIGLLFAAIVLIFALVGVAAVFYPRLGSDNTLIVLPVQLLLYLFVYLIFRLLFLLRYDRPALHSLGWVPSSFRLSWAVGGGIVLAFAVAALAAVLKTPKVESPIESLLKSPVLLTCFGIMAVTLAPFFEELFFRGFIQPLLSRTFGFWAGIVLTAILFGSLHAPEYQFAWQYAVAVSIVGLVLGWVRARAQSIIPSTVMHGAYNSVFVVLLLVTRFHPKS
jgi:membrane protease YdiL (CAAX protease family)